MTKINKLIVCTHPLITSLQFICHNSILILTFCTVIFKPVILKNRRKLRYLAFQQTWCICFWASLFKAPNFSVRSSRANAYCMGAILVSYVSCIEGRGGRRFIPTRPPPPQQISTIFEEKGQKRDCKQYSPQLSVKRLDLNVTLQSYRRVTF